MAIPAIPAAHFFQQLAAQRFEDGDLKSYQITNVPMLREGMRQMLGKDEILVRVTAVNEGPTARPNDLAAFTNKPRLTTTGGPQRLLNTGNR
mmetsp:Transcript_114826/g.245138  ORF Transcript_114826/g.245138 Transcript_114826/m.245138 type:complete len:92 (+) Transcript_114826:70-345(+)